MPEIREALVNDTDRLIFDALRADRQVLRELLTTPRSYVMIDALRQLGLDLRVADLLQCSFPSRASSSVDRARRSQRRGRRFDPDLVHQFQPHRGWMCPAAARVVRAGRSGKVARQRGGRS